MPKSLPTLTLALLVTGACFPGGPAAFTVNTTTDAVDANPGDAICATSAGLCSVRAAIQESNAMPGLNTVILPSGTYPLTLPEPVNGGIAGGDLDVTDTLRIRGVGATSRISGEDNFRVLDIAAVFVRLDSLSIRHGSHGQEGGGIRLAQDGLVWAYGIQLFQNFAHSRGGGIMNRGSMVLYASVLAQNHTNARGGAIRASTQATTTLWNSTLTGNSANIGAGMHSQGSASVFNTTVSGNSGVDGAGGIYNDGFMRIANATIAFNTASVDASNRPGGVWNGGDGALVIRNSIIGRNSNPGGVDDCSGTLFSEGYNLIEDTGGCTITGTTTGNITGQDPDLDPLQVYGQGTATHRLRPTSPAIDVGNPAAPGGPPPACWSLDQRGIARADCDIGAYEVGG